MRIGRRTGPKVDRESKAFVWGSGKKLSLAVEEMAVVTDLPPSLLFFSF